MREPLRSGRRQPAYLTTAPFAVKEIPHARDFLAPTPHRPAHVEKPKHARPIRNPIPWPPPISPVPYPRGNKNCSSKFCSSLIRSCWLRFELRGRDGAEQGGVLGAVRWGLWLSGSSQGYRRAAGRRFQEAGRCDSAIFSIRRRKLQIEFVGFL